MRSQLTALLRHPARARQLDARQWEQLVSEGRGSRLLGSLAGVLRQRNTLDAVPAAVRRHLDSAWQIHLKTRQDVNYETGRLLEAFSAIGEKVILLKGAAYLQAGLAPASGRTLSDIDLLTPATRIAEAESALREHGWLTSKMSAYDQRYYRQWMHEIPPMFHRRRNSVLDLHHTILPPTAATSLDPRRLFEETVEISPGVHRLSDRDMVIHSAAHLFHEGEFHSGLRDLWDLDRMLRAFPALSADFWDQLLARAATLDMTDFLYHGLRHSHAIFATPVPEEVLARTQSLERRIKSPLMDFLFRRAFAPPHEACQLAASQSALLALYVRSHYLRMPLRLLLPHLARKFWMGRFPEAGKGGNNTA